MGVLEDARDAIADVITATCPLVKRAYNYVPPAVNAADLPAAIVLTGNGVYNYASWGAQVIGEDRTFTVLLLCAEYAEDRFPLGGSQQTAAAVFEQVRNALLTYRRLITVANPEPTRHMMQLASDNGIAARQYGTKYYVGSEFTVTVRYTNVTDFI